MVKTEVRICCSVSGLHSQPRWILQVKDMTDRLDDAVMLRRTQSSDEPGKGLPTHDYSLISAGDAKATCVPAPSPHRLEPRLTLELLCSRAFCDFVREWHFAILRLAPDCDEAEAVAGFWDAARSFASLTDEDKAVAGGFMRSEVNDPNLIVGFTAMDDNEFLETRLGPGGIFHPREMSSFLVLSCRRQMAAHARGCVHTGKTRPGIAERFLRGRQALTSVGATAVCAVARDLGREPSKLLRLMDDGTKVPDGSLSPSAQRVCHYRPKAASANDEKKAAPKKSVAFGAHTVQ